MEKELDLKLRRLKHSPPVGFLTEARVIIPKHKTDHANPCFKTFHCFPLLLE